MITPRRGLALIAFAMIVMAAGGGEVLQCLHLWTSFLMQTGALTLHQFSDSEMEAEQNPHPPRFTLIFRGLGVQRIVRGEF